MATQPEMLTPNNLMGLYSPVYLGDVLKYFVNTKPENFGSLKPIDAITTGNPGAALMDSLPLLKQGYCLRNSITQLFSVYIYVNELQDPQEPQFVFSDQLMRTSFDSQIPALFYISNNDQGQILKMFMMEAVRQKVISGPMTTYDVIRKNYPDFYSNKFESFYFQIVSSLNYYTLQNLNTDPTLKHVLEYLVDANTKISMIQEHELIKNALDGWKLVLNPELNILANKLARLPTNTPITPAPTRQLPTFTFNNTPIIPHARGKAQTFQVLPTIPQKVQTTTPIRPMLTINVPTEQRQIWLNKWQEEVQAQGLNPQTLQQPTMKYLKQRYGPLMLN